MVGHAGVRHRRVDGDRAGVDLARADHRREPRADAGRTPCEEMRRRVVEDGREVPHGRIGVERRAVVKAHALPEGDDEARRVHLVVAALDGEAGDEVAGALGLAQIPDVERVEDGVAAEAHALEAAVGPAPHTGHVDERDRDAQRARRLRERRVRGQEQKARRGGEKAAACHVDRHGFVLRIRDQWVSKIA